METSNFFVFSSYIIHTIINKIKAIIQKMVILSKKNNLKQKNKLVNKLLNLKNLTKT